MLFSSVDIIDLDVGCLHGNVNFGNLHNLLIY